MLLIEKRSTSPLGGTRKFQSEDCAEAKMLLNSIKQEINHMFLLFLNSNFTFIPTSISPIDYLEAKIASAFVVVFSNNFINRLVQHHLSNLIKMCQKIKINTSQTI
jgi:hypothetical protein